MTDKTFGLHLTLDVEGCEQNKLTDNKFIYRLLNDLPGKCDMEKITLPYTMEWKDKFADIPGITGFVVIAESHIAIHTFPEQRYCFVDIFSCRHFEADKIADEILRHLGSDKAEKHIVERGRNFMAVPNPQLVPSDGIHNYS